MIILTLFTKPSILKKLRVPYTYISFCIKLKDTLRWKEGSCSLGKCTVVWEDSVDVRPGKI